MKYYFDVYETEIICTNAKKTIVADAVNYHVAHFTFKDTIWNNYGKTPIFKNAKSGVAVNGNPLDENNECYIPYEAITIVGNNNYLNVGMRFTYTDTEALYHEVYTRMLNEILILSSSMANFVTPDDPSGSVYDAIMQEFANRYVDTLFLPDKEILTTDWITESGLFNITQTFTPTIILNQEIIMRTGSFGDYLDTISYSYEDFYLYYSTDGITTSSQAGTSQTVANANQRKIQFQIGLNEYEIRITQSQITVKRLSGTTPYYIHNLWLRFDDYFYYDYQVDGLTEYYKSSIFLYDESRDTVSQISFRRYPEFTGDTIRNVLSQKPSIDIHTRFFAFKTNKEIGFCEILNTYGNSIFYNVSVDPISDLDTTEDNRLAIIGNIKEYVHSVVVSELQSYGLIP